MNEIFLIFLSLSLSGSLIALVLFLLKPIIKDRLSKTWQYYIFLIVVVRLLVPFGPDTSLMGMLFNQAGGYVALENDPATVPDAGNTLQTPPTVAPEMQPDESAGNPLRRTANIGQMALEWLWLAWLIPAAALLLRKVVGYICFTRSVKAGCVEIETVRLLEIYREVCREMRIKHPPGLALNEKVTAPMLVGAVRPVIVLPEMDVKDNDLRYILRHELTHHKRLDIVYKWLVQIAVCLHWYNPLVYWVSRESTATANCPVTRLSLGAWTKLDNEPMVICCLKQ